MARARAAPLTKCAVALIAGAAAGCSLLVGLDDDLTGGDLPAAEADARVEEASGPALEDASAPLEDVAEADASPLPPFCPLQSEAIFCADFDSADLLDVFDVRTVDRGDVARTTRTFTSPQHALEAKLFAQTAPTGEAIATVSRTITEGAGLLLDAKVRVDERATGAGSVAEVLVIDIRRADNTFYQLGIRVLVQSSTIALELYEYDSFTGDTRAFNGREVIADRTWVPVQLAVSYDQTRAELMRFVDGKAVTFASGTLSTGPLPPVPRDYQIGVGLYAYGVQPGWVAQVDDVLVRKL